MTLYRKYISIPVELPNGMTIEFEYLKIDVSSISSILGECQERFGTLVKVGSKILEEQSNSLYISENGVYTKLPLELDDVNARLRAEWVDLIHGQESYNIVIRRLHYSHMRRTQVYIEYYEDVDMAGALDYLRSLIEESSNVKDISCLVDNMQI